MALRISSSEFLDSIELNAISTELNLLYLLLSPLDSFFCIWRPLFIIIIYWLKHFPLLYSLIDSFNWKNDFFSFTRRNEIHNNNSKTKNIIQNYKEYVKRKSIRHNNGYYYISSISDLHALMTLMLIRSLAEQ